PHRRLGGVAAAGDALVRVAAVAGGVGADDSKLVSEPGEFLKRRTEGDAGQSRLHLAVEAARLDRRRHFWIEKLDMRRTTLQEQQDDRAVLDGFAGRGSAGGKKTRQRQSAEPQGADLEELAPAEPLAVTSVSRVEECEHAVSPPFLANGHSTVLTLPEKRRTGK